MVRKHEKKPKKNIKLGRRRKVHNQSSKNMSANSSEMNFTLPENYHQDSFDLFISNDHEALREKNILKADVHASFNLDSSIEIDTEPSQSSLTMSSCSLEQSNKDDNSKKCISQSDSYVKTSLNCHTFNKSPQPLEQLDHAETKTKDFKYESPQKSWTNIRNAAFYVSPIIKILNPQNVQTSTPEPVNRVMDFDVTDLDSIHEIENTPRNMRSSINHASNLISLPTYISTRRKRNLNTKYSPISSHQKFENGKAATISAEFAIDTGRATESSPRKKTQTKDITCSPTNFIAKTLVSPKLTDESTNHMNLPAPTTDFSKTDQLSIINFKTRVGFGAPNLIHNFSAISHAEDDSKSRISNNKLKIKGGKWRRTIFEMRKNKVTLSPKRTLESGNVKEFKQSLRRKSIFIKDIPSRKTLAKEDHQTSQIVTVLDESDVESICSSDFSTKSTSINVHSKIGRSRLQPIYDSVDLECIQKTSRKLNNGSQLSLCDSSSIESVLNEIEDSTSNLHLEFNQDSLKAQLLKRCGQTDVYPFDEVYSASALNKSQKIGEGVFGEVFLNDTYVLKIIPIEGTVEINGAQQKRFDEILQEVIISQELAGLRYGEKNCTSGFAEVLKVRLVEGRYPEHLLNLWDDYDIRQGSENDRPDLFGDDQLYVVFELANGGSDLEAHVFKNAEQSFSAFKQVAISLAVAESIEFEHRDLHWGNVLVRPTTEKSVTFHLNGRPIEVRTHGIKATIIDYTLSRIVYKDCCLFQDLAADPELFEAVGDYQFDVYRLMRKKTENYWEVFEPYTNILWLHYLVDKMIDGVNYTSKKGNKHRNFMAKMLELRDELLEYRSATECIEDVVAIQPNDKI